MISIHKKGGSTAERETDEKTNKNIRRRQLKCLQWNDANFFDGEGGFFNRQKNNIKPMRTREDVDKIHLDCRILQVINRGDVQEAKKLADEGIKSPIVHKDTHISHIVWVYERRQLRFGLSDCTRRGENCSCNGPLLAALIKDVFSSTAELNQHKIECLILLGAFEPTVEYKHAWRKREYLALEYDAPFEYVVKTVNYRALEIFLRYNKATKFEMSYAMHHSIVHGNHEMISGGTSAPRSPHLFMDIYRYIHGYIH